MSKYINKLQSSGITEEEIDQFKSKIKITMEYMFENYEYEPWNKDGLIMAMQSMMFRTIVSHCEELNKDIQDEFTLFYSDFEKPTSSNATGSLQVILGSANTVNFEKEYINRDIRMLSSLIMKRNYMQDMGT